MLRSRSGNGIWRGQDWCANIQAGGQALASSSESPVTFSHPETVMKINEQFFLEFNGEEHTEYKKRLHVTCCRSVGKSVKACPEAYSYWA